MSDELRRRAMNYAADLIRALTTEILSRPLTERDVDFYRTDPVAYAKERLGVELMPHQSAIAYAAAGQWHKITAEMAELAQLKNPGGRKIAIRSAVKTGKSTLLVVIALWYFECCRDRTHGAKFLLTAAKGDQIRTVIWAELKRILRIAPHPPEGTVARDPIKGFKSPDESCVILGFTGRNAESVAGQSENLALAVDEASALEKEKADAISGNRAGGGDYGAFQIWFANPTRSSGPLYDAFHSQTEFYTTAHFDGVRISEWNERQAKPTKFIITSQAIRESAEENGENDPFHVVRMRGKFVEGEVGKVIPMTTIAAMQERWRELWVDGEGDPLKGRALEARRAVAYKTTRLGRLHIGFDPAGEKIGRDESGFAVVRGNVCLDVYTRRGLSKADGLAELWGLMARYRADGEVPELSVDVEGDIGNEYRLAIAAERERRALDRADETFVFHAVRASSKDKVRDRRNFVRVRGEIWKALSEWAKVGAVPPDGKLETELYCPRWIPLATGQSEVSSKQEIRDAIHRSCDRADALCLAVYQSRTMADELGQQGGRPAPVADTYEQSASFGDGYDQGAPFWPSE